MSRYRLPEGVKKAWVQALRSGEYNQARGQLADSGGDCCLGVLADVAGCLSSDGHYIDGAGLMGRMALLGSDSELEVLPENVQTRLAEMNDGGKSFDEIADYIEKHL